MKKYQLLKTKEIARRLFGDTKADYNRAARLAHSGAFGPKIYGGYDWAYIEAHIEKSTFNEVENQRVDLTVDRLLREVG